MRKLSIIPLNEKDYSKLRKKHPEIRTRLLRTSLGLAIPSKNVAYIRVTNNYKEDQDTAMHEVEELIKDNSAHEVNGVRYKQSWYSSITRPFHKGEPGQGVSGILSKGGKGAGIAGLGALALAPFTGGASLAFLPYIMAAGGMAQEGIRWGQGKGTGMDVLAGGLTGYGMGSAAGWGLGKAGVNPAMFARPAASSTIGAGTSYAMPGLTYGGGAGTAGTVGAGTSYAAPWGYSATAGVPAATNWATGLAGGYGGGAMASGAGVGAGAGGAGTNWLGSGIKGLTTGVTKNWGPILAAGGALGMGTAQPPEYQPIDYGGVLEKYGYPQGRELPKATQEQLYRWIKEPIQDIVGTDTDAEFARVERTINKSYDESIAQLQRAYTGTGGRFSTDVGEEINKLNQRRGEELGMARGEIENKLMQQGIQMKQYALGSMMQQGQFDMGVAMELAKLMGVDEQLKFSIENDDYSGFQKFMQQIMSMGLGEMTGIKGIGQTSPVNITFGGGATK